MINRRRFLQTATATAALAAQGFSGQALAQQAATDRLIQVISDSRSDAQPVFDTIVASAVGLCDGVIGVVYLFDGEAITLAAQYDALGEPDWDHLRSLFPMPPAAE